MTLTVLADVWLRHPEGKPFPSQTCLAKKSGQNVRTVRRHIAELVAAGLLRVYPNPPRRGPGGRFVRRTNRYQFLGGQTRPQNRRSHLEGTPALTSVKRGVVTPPLFVSPPEMGPDLDVARSHLAAVRAQLAALRR